MAAFAQDVVTLRGAIDFNTANLFGMRPEYGLDDAGNTNQYDQSYWWSYGKGDNESIITNYLTVAERYHAFDPAVNPRPAYMSDRDENTGYVRISTDSALSRLFLYAKANGIHSKQTLLESNDLFIDSLMRMFEVSFDPSEILEADAEMVDARFIFGPAHIDAVGTNRLVVVCGRYAADGTLYRTNYITSVSIDPRRWYRVTARAIRTASSTSSVTYSGAKRNYPCFVLYLDGVPVTCAEGDYSIGDDKAQMDVLFAGNPHYAARSLFPMIGEFKQVAPNLKGVAYRGTCEMDEYGVVKEGNPLAVPSANLSVALARDPMRVTNVTVKVIGPGETEPYLTTNDSTSACIVLKLNPGDKIKVEPLTRAGYTPTSALSLSGNKSAYVKDETSGYTVQLADSFTDSSQLTMTIKVNGAFFAVGGEEYATLVQAIEAARDLGESRISLVSDVTLERDALADNGQMRVLADDMFVFDLMGHSIKGDHFREEALVYAQGRLTVLDTVGGGAIEAPGTAIEVVSDNDAVEVNHEHAHMTLGSEEVQNPFTVRGRVRCTEGELEIKGGTYLTPKSESGEEFYLSAFVDAERFSWSEDGLEPGIGKYWTVVYGGKLEVRFECEQGFGFEPWRALAYPGTTIAEPRLATNGFVVTSWYVQDTGAEWSFTNKVERSMTLVAQAELETYKISYPTGMAYPPYSYTVETPLTVLRSPEKKHFSFTGWVDTNSNRRVNRVGMGATFVDHPDCVVTGNLALAATWSADANKWTNADAGLSESNGCYIGEWTMTMPIGDNGFYRGDKIILDEIAFSIVNPLLYPKTAEYLTIRTPDGSVTSALRDDHAASLSIGMLIGADALKNGRPRVAYQFPTGVELTVGTVYYVYFSTSDGTPASGIFRMVRKPDADDRIFGNCTFPGGSIERYREYCPVYEITGHAPEGGTGD